ncbi:MAG TPA: glutathione S-transferase family protein [Rhizomicrobium sp.]|nr:glutathione S-transferase family protein [Rhizomicrobium sp.]
MLRIWGRRNSSNVQKVLWLAGELGLDYEHIPAGGRFGGLDEPSFRRMNPHGRVPVLEDGDHAIWESHAILRYLASQYGDGSLWPADPGAKAQLDMWMDWTQTGFQPDFLNGVFWGYYRTPESQRNWPAIQESIGRCSRHIGLIDEILADRPFLGGNGLSLADIPLGTLLYRYYELDIERPKAAHVEAWYDRLRDRSAYREHVMVAFDELRGRLRF